MPSAEQMQRNYAALAEQAEKLCATAVVFSDKVENPVWKDGLLAEVEQLRELIKIAPRRSPWNGELHEDDLEITFYRAPGQTIKEEPRGVIIRHKPTDITRESYSQISQMSNREVVIGALTKAVGEHYADQGEYAN